MSPWNVIGWLIVASIAIPALFFVAAVVVAIVQTAKDKGRHRRAQAGRLGCDDADCTHLATRQTPLGFFCDLHWPLNDRKQAGFGSVSYANLLAYKSKD